MEVSVVVTVDTAVDGAVVAVVLLGVVSAVLTPTAITNHTILQQTEDMRGRRRRCDMEGHYWSFIPAAGQMPETWNGVCRMLLLV